jgi:hypothetical protein
MMTMPLDQLGIFQIPHPPLNRKERWHLGILGEKCVHGEWGVHYVKMPEDKLRILGGMDLHFACPGPGMGDGRDSKDCK